MGRKPHAFKTNDTTQLLPTIVEPQAFSGNVQSPGALDSKHEIPPPGIAPLKHPNLSVDGAMRHEKKPALEHKHQKKSPTVLSRKISNYSGGSVRRSERIKSALASPHKTNSGIEYIEDITVSDSEKDEVNTHMEQVLAEVPLEPESEPEPVGGFGEKSLEEKVDWALQRIEVLDKTVELLKSKVDENIGFSEAPSMGSINYRSMYIDSQKKVEALTNENRLLNGKLENALGKVEVYEQEVRVLVDVLDKTKEAVNAAMISNVAKTIEAAVNVSTQAIHNACSASAVKRKRNES